MSDGVPIAAADREKPYLSNDVADFYTAYARTLDTRQIDRWIEFFAPDGLYSLTTLGNANGKGMYLIYEKGIDAITRRAAVASGYLKVQRTKTLHMISNLAVKMESPSFLTVEAYFAVFRTGRDRTSQFHACGEFHDSLRLDNGRFQLQEHNVVFDAETLPANMADLY